MSYQVLARKWRPKNFSELMGQEHVVTVLVNALNQKRLHHAYLFTGTRGVGKTTIARIFAKSLNCETGITATPCGKCDVCLDIDQGRFIDLLEIDAASKTKVDDTREILDNVQYAPSRGRYKVYLIDEVHMLSRSSFNALLKTLEEPPEHVKFILATTDPQKLPVTVLSRCLQFHLKALTRQQISQQLYTILAAEKVTFEETAITLLAKAARGSMRDSLSLADQAIAQGQGNISVSNVQQMLGGVDHNWPFKILIHLLKQDAQALMLLSQEIASYAPSYSRLLAELIQLLHQIALAQIVEQQFDLSPEQAKLLSKFAQAMSPEDVQLYYQIALNGRKDLPYAADEQAAFDMVILRLLAFKPLANVSDIAHSDHVNTEFENSTDEKENNINNADVVTTLSTEDLAVTDINKPSTSVVAAPKIKNTQPANECKNEEVSQIAINSPVDSMAANSIQESVQNQEQALKPKTVIAANNTKIPAASDENEHLVSLESESANHVSSGVDTILADRNMLRSRRKSQEDDPKKSNGANKRQQQDQQSTKTEQLKAAQIKNLPSTASLPTVPFTPDIIDPAQIRKANQVDKWAHMIDSMALGGRLRQLAIHATVDEKSTDDLLILNLDQATKHLVSDNAYQQLEQSLSELLAKSINVEVNIVSSTEADPYKIQSHINDKRYQYAKELLAQDEIVQTLQQDYQATIDENSIKAL